MNENCKEAVAHAPANVADTLEQCRKQTNINNEILAGILAQVRGSQPITVNGEVKEAHEIYSLAIGIDDVLEALKISYDMLANLNASLKNNIGEVQLFND